MGGAYIFKMSKYHMGTLFQFVSLSAFWLLLVFLLAIGDYMLHLSFGPGAALYSLVLRAQARPIKIW